MTTSTLSLFQDLPVLSAPVRMGFAAATARRTTAAMPCETLFERQAVPFRPVQDAGIERVRASARGISTRTKKEAVPGCIAMPPPGHGGNEPEETFYANSAACTLDVSPTDAMSKVTGPKKADASKGAGREGASAGPCSTGEQKMNAEETMTDTQVGKDRPVKGAMLTAEQETALYLRWKAQDPSAAEEILAAFDKLLWSIANKWASHKNRQEGDIGDFKSAVDLGFLKGVSKFDPKKINPETGKPYRLSTYCRHWATDEVSTLAFEDKVVGMTGIMRAGDRQKVAKALDACLREKGSVSDADIESIAHDCKVSIRSVRTLRGVSTMAVSLDPFDGVDADGEPTEATLNLVAEGPSPEEAALAADAQRKGVAALLPLLRNLPERTRYILEELFFRDEPRTMAAIARDLGVSPQRVSEIHKDALKSLGAALVAAGLTAEDCGLI